MFKNTPDWLTFYIGVGFGISGWETLWIIIDRLRDRHRRIYKRRDEK